MIRRPRADGFTVAATARAPLSPGSLALFLAAARDFYEVLIEGEWDAQANTTRSYYAYANPMYFEVLQRWKREPFALRSERRRSRLGWHPRREPRTQPAQAGWLLPGTQPDLAATLAGEAKAVRVLIGAAIRFMIDVAPLRERVILRLLDETGARLHEVLAMTAGGYRKGHSRLVGVRALLRNKGSLGREVKPVTFEPETDYLLHRHLRTVRSKHDPERRARMEDLRDDEPLFLSQRGHHLRIAASVSTGGDCP